MLYSLYITSQRLLAELTEKLHIGFLIHRGIIDQRYLSKAEGKPMADIEVGNKLSVLSGDYLFATACIALSALKNSKVCIVFQIFCSLFCSKSFNLIACKRRLHF